MIKTLVDSYVGHFFGIKVEHVHAKDDSLYHIEPSTGQAFGDIIVRSAVKHVLFMKDLEVFHRREATAMMARSIIEAVDYHEWYYEDYDTGAVSVLNGGIENDVTG